MGQEFQTETYFFLFNIGGN